MRGGKPEGRSEHRGRRHRVVSGRISDPDIQRLILAAAQEENPAVRVESVGLLTSQAGAASEIREVLLNAIAHDVGMNAHVSPTPSSPVHGLDNGEALLRETVAVAAGRLVGFDRLDRWLGR